MRSIAVGKCFLKFKKLNKPVSEVEILNSSCVWLYQSLFHILLHIYLRNGKSHRKLKSKIPRICNIFPQSQLILHSQHTGILPKRFVFTPYKKIKGERKKRKKEKEGTPPLTFHDIKISIVIWWCNKKKNPLNCSPPHPNWRLYSELRLPLDNKIFELTCFLIRNK